MVESVNAPNLKVQMDLYHCQIVEGDVSAAAALPAHRPRRASADRRRAAAARARPGRTELFLDLCALRELDYRGWIGCEYRPAGATSDGLGWLAAARA